MRRRRFLTALVIIASTLTLNNTWTNGGMIASNNGSTTNLGGNFSLATLGAFMNNGGTVNLNGALDNTGPPLVLDGTTGSWQMNGGSITGGSVTLMGGATLIPLNHANNLLSNVTVTGISCQMNLKPTV